MPRPVLRLIAAFCLAGLAVQVAHADTVRVAVAANFAVALDALATAFHAATGHDIVASTGSTGRHYAQIVNGAPFDLFLAADAARPARLEADGRGVPGSRFTYATGRLALWSPQAGLVDGRGEVLGSDSFRHLAIANPRLAPYGEAARQVLAGRALWQPLQDRLVYGENIGQAHHFVTSGAAELGFVAWSQVRRPGQEPAGSWWLVPAALHAPIEQQAILLSKRPAARQLAEFLRGATARAIIRDHGYGTD